MTRTISASFKGLDQAIKAAGDLGPLVEKAAYEAVAETAANGEATLKEIHRHAGRSAAGRTYRRGKTVEHRASAPRNPPAPDAGAAGGLLGSIYHNKIRPGFWLVGSRIKYALLLEFGTRKIKPRPMWRPAAKIIKKDLIKNVNDNIAKVLRMKA